MGFALTGGVASLFRFGIFAALFWIKSVSLFATQQDRELYRTLRAIQNPEKAKSILHQFYERTHESILDAVKSWTDSEIRTLPGPVLFVIKAELIEMEKQRGLNSSTLNLIEFQDRRLDRAIAIAFGPRGNAIGQNSRRRYPLQNQMETKPNIDDISVKRKNMSKFLKEARNAALLFLYYGPEQVGALISPSSAQQDFNEGKIEAQVNPGYWFEFPELNAEGREVLFYFTDNERLPSLVGFSQIKIYSHIDPMGRKIVYNLNRDDIKKMGDQILKINEIIAKAKILKTEKYSMIPKGVKAESLPKVEVWFPDSSVSLFDLRNKTDQKSKKAAFVLHSENAPSGEYLLVSSKFKLKDPRRFGEINIYTISKDGELDFLAQVPSSFFSPEDEEVAVTEMLRQALAYPHAELAHPRCIQLLKDLKINPNLSIDDINH